MANLETIRDFHSEQDASAAFQRFIGHLFDELIPNLERFPEMGRDFLKIPVGSVEGQARLRLLRDRLSMGLQIREYIARDYLILYSVSDGNVDLLAIKHHKQLSFDLGAHWL